MEQAFSLLVVKRAPSIDPTSSLLTQAPATVDDSEVPSQPDDVQPNRCLPPAVRWISFDYHVMDHSEELFHVLGVQGYVVTDR